MCRFWIPAVALWMVAAVMPAWANEGVFLSGYDTIQLQRAGAGVASPRSAAWMILNPAGLTQLDNRIDLNLYSVFTDAELRPAGLIGNRLDGQLQDEGNFHIPSFGTVYETPYGTLAAGKYVLSGAGVDYPRSRNLLSRLFQQNQDRRLKYAHFRFVGAYAYEFDNGWSVGVAAHASVARFLGDHITLRLRPTSGNNEPDYTGGFGFGLGVQKNWERVSIGASYMSRHWSGKFDDYTDLLPFSFDLPETVQAGLALRVSDAFEIVADYRFLRWRDVSFFGEPILQGGFDWENQHGTRVGFEYTPLDRWAFRAGYSYSNSPVTEENVFISGLVPASTEHQAMAGLSFRPFAHHEFHMAAVHGFQKTLRDTGGGSIFSRLGAGTEISTSGNSFSVGYTVHF